MHASTDTQRGPLERPPAGWAEAHERVALAIGTPLGGTALGSAVATPGRLAAAGKVAVRIGTPDRLTSTCVGAGVGN